MLPRLVFGDSTDMSELDDGSVHLVVTSPPYYNAPFDYPGLFFSYDEYLSMLRKSAKELKRVLDKGRIAALVVDDTLIDGIKYPIVSDVTRIFIETGFKYRDRITWRKPDGYVRISRRSGVLIQHPYPMYYYPDNLQESILIFQNGKFDYKSISQHVRENSRIDVKEFQENKWYLTVWDITNVLPHKNRLEHGVAAFPEEIASRLIQLYSYKEEKVLDPFLGSGTTIKVADSLQRLGIGYEIDIELKEIIMEKTGITEKEVLHRSDHKKLRSILQKRVLRETE